MDEFGLCLGSAVMARQELVEVVTCDIEKLLNVSKMKVLVSDDGKVKIKWQQ